MRSGKAISTNRYADEAGKDRFPNSLEYRSGRMRRYPFSAHENRDA